MAQSKSFSVGIAGVTGKFAGLILDSLLENSNVSIRGYCRNASKLASRYVQSSQMEVVQGDATDPNTLSKFVDGLDVVICAYLGDNDFMVNAQKALVDACDKARVPRYIASDYCLDFTKLELGQHPAKDPMKIIYDYVNEKDYVKGVHVLIGAFMETFWSTYFQVWNAEEKTLVYWGTGEETWESTTYGDAAKFTAAVALDPNAVGLQKCEYNKDFDMPSLVYHLTFTVLGDKKNIYEIAQAIKNAYGFTPKLQREGSLDDLYNTMQSSFKKEPSNVYAWLAL